MRTLVLKIRKTRKVTCLIGNYHSFSCVAITIGTLMTFSDAGEYSADDAWDFKELEEAITKSYF